MDSEAKTEDLKILKEQENSSKNVDSRNSKEEVLEEETDTKSKAVAVADNLMENDSDMKNSDKSKHTDEKKDVIANDKDNDEIVEKTDVKEKNGTIGGGDKKKSKVAKAEKDEIKDSDEDDGANAKEKNGPEADKNEEIDDDENVVALAEIDRINENINKTRVDGLQTLHTICFGDVGKNNVVKKNLRSFAGFEFTKDSSEYKKKLDSIKKVDIKSLKSICDILSLNRRGTKDDVANRILKFLMEPDESLCEDVIEDDEDEEELLDEKDASEEEASEEEDRRRRKPQSGRGAGRPRRATAGKKMSAYVDFSTSDESEEKDSPPKRKRNDDSESGSDYNPSMNSDSDGARGRKGPPRAGRGRPARKSRRNNSDSESEESEPSDAEDSDVPRRKRAAPGRRGRPAVKKRGRGRASGGSRRRKDSDSEEEEISEDEEEEEMTDFNSEQTEEEEQVKGKKTISPAKNNKNNKSRSAAKPAGRPKKNKKESTEEEDLDDKDETDDDEPLTKKSKSSFPTDEQIRNYVKEILDKANLEEITMKTVCRQVYAKYPEFDLTDKKDFIKATVKALIAA